METQARVRMWLEKLALTPRSLSLGFFGVLPCFSTVPAKTVLF